MRGMGALCIALLLSGCGGGSSGNAAMPIIPVTTTTPASPSGDTPAPATCATSQCAPAP